MAEKLLPIGEYEYNRNEYNLDDAWEKVKESYNTGDCIICKVISQSEDNSLQVDFHGIKGVLTKGHITFNFCVNNDDLIGKTTCINVIRLNENVKSFDGTRIQVEELAHEQLTDLSLGDQIEGIVKAFVNNESSAFIDIKEGICAFLPLKKVTRLPARCCKMSDYINIGQKVQGCIYYFNIYDDSQQKTFCGISILDCGNSWEEEISDFYVGKVVSGYPKKDYMYMKANRYFIEYTKQICIIVFSESALDENAIINVEITHIKKETKIIYAKLVTKGEENNQQDSKADENQKLVSKNKNEQVLGTYGSLFDSVIKTEVSPFQLWDNEFKTFESTTKAYVSIEKIDDSIKRGHINEMHFNILRIINQLIYCTSKQILASLYQLYPSTTITHDKLNRKLDTMMKNAMIDGIGFENTIKKCNYRVYLLKKNGDIILKNYLGVKRSSYSAGHIFRPSSEIKRQLATNQIYLAYKEKLGIVQNIYIRKILAGEGVIPVRPSAILICSYSTVLLETIRRCEDWKEKLYNKMTRYQMLFTKYDENDLKVKASFEFMNMPLYLVLICEDLEHACEVRELLIGMDIFPRLLFTYDLLVFRKKVATSVFRFGNSASDIIYYDISKMFGYNIECKAEDKEAEKNDETIIEEFYNVFKRDYNLGLNYLIENDCQQLRDIVQSQLFWLYEIGEEGRFQSVLSDNEWIHIYLLYLIENVLLFNDTSSFHEEETDLMSEGTTEEIDGEKSDELTVQEHVSKPEDLEEAVKDILCKIENWMHNKYASDLLQITKHASGQASGMQYGYDVGIDFRFRGEEYHIGFECKNYQTLRAKSCTGNGTQLTISRYAYNLLEFFMSCENEENVHNHWILVCPFGDLQNDFYRNLFQRWNKELSFMQVDVISQKQTAITCEDLLSIDNKAYEKIYGITPPNQSEEEKNALIGRIFNSIIENKKLNHKEKLIHPFRINYEYNEKQQLMPIKTIDGDNAIEKILYELNNHTNGGVFVIGEYGSGKTYLTYRLIDVIEENTEQYAYCPLWFKLVDGEVNLDNDDIEDEVNRFIKNGLNLYPYLPEDFSFGGEKRLLIILDGVDEIISGLGESIRKVEFLQKVCECFKNRYSYCYIQFVITTRETDYAAYKSNRDFSRFLQKFGKIIIGDCNVEDVKKGILDIKQPAEDDTYVDKLRKISENDNLVGIAKKPLYFGFLRKLIISSDCLEYEDELDILEAIIHDSIYRYKDNDKTEDEIMDMLFTWAIDISEGLAEGKGDSIEIVRFLLKNDIEKNVLQSRKVDDDHYQIRFYHNAIREYLVAKKLFLDVRGCLMDGVVRDNLFKLMEKLDMTPETMKFFCAFVGKEEKINPQNRVRIISIFIKMLKSACEPSKEKLGSHILSLLLQLQPELSDCDLEGVHVNNIYLWNCSLKNINFRKARLCNCTFFNMKLDTIDFRDADLSGLSINPDDRILDVCHSVMNNELTVTVMYSTGQLVNYCFSDINCLSQYSIKIRGTINGREYKNFISFDDGELIYSDKNIYSTTKDKVVYKMKPENQLLCLNQQYAIVKMGSAVNIVVHDKYKQHHISGILQSEYNTICVIALNLYLTVRNQQLVLHKNDEIVPIIDLNANYECFSAYKESQKDIICIYVKYKDDIQKILYDFNKSKLEFSSLGLEKQFTCNKIVSVTESVLLCIADDIVYVFNPLADKYNIIELQTKVKCQNLILENEDGSQRVKGDKEYRILKEAEE